MSAEFWIQLAAGVCASLILTVATFSANYLRGLVLEIRGLRQDFAELFAGHGRHKRRLGQHAKILRAQGHTLRDHAQRIARQEGRVTALENRDSTGEP